MSRLKFDMNETFLAEDAKTVSIMFIYITDFDKLSNLYRDEVVNLLDRIFKGFDMLCTKHGIQKIETVGNTYLCACGE